MRPLDRARKKQLNEVLRERKGGKMRNGKRRKLEKIYEREAK